MRLLESETGCDDLTQDALDTIVEASFEWSPDAEVMCVAVDVSEQVLKLPF